MRITGTVYISPLQNGDRRLSNCERSTDGTKSMALRRKRMKQSSSGTVCALGAASVGAGGGSDCSIADVGEEMQSRSKAVDPQEADACARALGAQQDIRCSSREPRRASRDRTKLTSSRETLRDVNAVVTFSGIQLQSIVLIPVSFRKQHINNSRESDLSSKKI